ncbi:hypothetical protein D9599_03885 [Roseomonas sp. KE2513]|nr:hypothetical protein [Roseomonas sp. KE2513]
MLESLSWLIPTKTALAMSHAEWMMLVLSIYLHDIGLIITEDEFFHRDKSNFPSFKMESLIGDGANVEYAAKIKALPEVELDRFLYQEFVRKNHGARARAWLEGRHDQGLGFALGITDELQRLFSSLPSDVRTDLGILCESHGLDDLEDPEKYRLNHPYGNNPQESVNLQYIAVMLRTADLMQITSDRAPSTLFRLINPSDPVSQREWSKQAAVRSVRPQLGRDNDGNVSETAPTSIIEVFARFKDANGYFGLTSYLRYAEGQLRLSHDVVERAKRHVVKSYDFPWKTIDISRIEAEGFLKETFGFELDQQKILDLLTGHTLYNDSTVALRELVQNAIDAVRLQASISETDSRATGKITITWNGTDNELEVRDNGTGMTQAIVTNHLLKVGSSRYQDGKFKEDYPAFSPISRFGIGVLSAFMIADSVEIVTCSDDEEEGRQISLRSVHGQYLIKLLKKHSDPAALALGSRGTAFRLRLRATASKVDVLATVRQWIQYPRCQVCVVIDDQPPVQVGFDDPKQALEALLASGAMRGRVGDAETRVVQRKIDGLTLAYAVTHDAFFRSWGFVAGLEKEEAESLAHLPAGMSIEGIAVSSASPGFAGRPILSCADLIGPGAPRTNVARSAIEETPELTQYIEKIYQCYFNQVADEARRLHDEEAYSTTRATGEIPFLASPLMNPQSGRVLREDLYQQSAAALPLFLVENEQHRTVESLNDLLSRKVFWTTDSLLVQSVEHLIREAHSDLTAEPFLRSAEQNYGGANRFPRVCNMSENISIVPAVLANFEIGRILADPRTRRLDLEWTRAGEERRWITANDVYRQLRNTAVRQLYRSTLERTDPYGSYGFSRRFGSVVGRNTFCVASGIVEVAGLEQYTSFDTLSSFYVLPDRPVTNFLHELFTRDDDEEKFRGLLYADVFRQLVRFRPIKPRAAAAVAERTLRDLSSKIYPRELPDAPDFISMLQASDDNLSTFNPFAWGQRSVEE